MGRYDNWDAISVQSIPYEISMFRIDIGWVLVNLIVYPMRKYLLKRLVEPPSPDPNDAQALTGSRHFKAAARRRFGCASEFSGKPPERYRFEYHGQRRRWRRGSVSTVHAPSSGKLSEGIMFTWTVLRLFVIWSVLPTQPSNLLSFCFFLNKYKQERKA